MSSLHNKNPELFKLLSSLWRVSWMPIEAWNFNSKAHFKMKEMLRIHIISHLSYWIKEEVIFGYGVTVNCLFYFWRKVASVDGEMIWTEHFIDKCLSKWWDGLRCWSNSVVQMTEHTNTKSVFFNVMQELSSSAQWKALCVSRMTGHWESMETAIKRQVSST